MFLETVVEEVPFLHQVLLQSTIGFKAEVAEVLAVWGET